MADRVFPVFDTPPRRLPVREVEEEETHAIMPPPPWRSPPAPERSVKFQDPEAMRILTPAPSFHKLVSNYGGRGCNCCCLCFIALLSLIVTFTVIFVGILFLVYQPKAPKFSIDKLSIHGFNLTPSASSTNYSPVIALTVTFYNHNKMIGIDYKTENSVTVAHYSVELGRGIVPAGYQPSKNKTIFQIQLKGCSVVLGSEDYKVLKEEMMNKEIPLRLGLNVPIIMNLGSIKTWTMMVKGHCYVKVDNLRNDSSIVSNKCYSSVTPWR